MVPPNGGLLVAACYVSFWVSCISVLLQDGIHIFIVTDIITWRVAKIRVLDKCGSLWKKAPNSTPLAISLPPTYRIGRQYDSVPESVCWNFLKNRFRQTTYLPNKTVVFHSDETGGTVSPIGHISVRMGLEFKQNWTKNQPLMLIPELFSLPVALFVFEHDFLA